MYPILQFRCVRQLRHAYQNRARVATAVALAAVLVVAILLMSAGDGPSVRAQTAPCPNLLQNSSFEHADGWSTQTNGTYAILSNYRALNGAVAAYLAGVNNAVDSVHTTLTLPTAEVLTLSFWSLVETVESGTGMDIATVIVADANGEPLETVATFSDIDASENWQQTQVDLSAYAGQTIQLQLHAETDASQETDFYFDNVTVTTCAAQSDNEFTIYLPVARP